MFAHLDQVRHFESTDLVRCCRLKLIKSTGQKVTVIRQIPQFALLLMLWFGIPGLAYAPHFGGADLTGLVYFSYTIIGLLLLCAFFVQNFFLQLLLAFPAVISAVVFSSNLFVWQYSESHLLDIALGFSITVVLLILFLRSKKPNFKYFTTLGLASVYLLAILANPAYFGFVEVVPEQNDPAKGTAVSVVQIIEKSYIYSDEHKQYRVDNTLVLDDGRRVPGIFHSTSEGDVVVLKKTNGGDYAYELHGLKEVKFKPVVPNVKFPAKPFIVRKAKLIRLTGVIGWDHDF